MLLLNPWRLGLLFLISGVASRHLLCKLGGARAFLGSRSARLLLPLAMGMALWVAPQAWVELSEKGGYVASFANFWLHDYFAFGTTFSAYKPGFILPTWNHLWFVAYLWAYTLVPAAGAALLGGRSLQSTFDRLLGGWRLWLLPLAWLWAAREWLYTRFGETHALVGDWYAHATYLPLFLFGFALARAPAMFDRAARAWKPLLAVALAGCAYTSVFSLAFPDGAAPPSALAVALARLAREAQTWAMMLGLIGLATAHLNCDTQLRHWLTQAIFPFYIAHQTVILLVEHALKPMQLGSTAEFAILLPATVAGCLAFAAIGRPAGRLSPAFGLARSTFPMR